MLKICFITAILCFPFITCCPSKEALHPCVCTTNVRDEISCPGLENEQVLMDVMFALKYSGKFYSFTIEKGNFRFLPHDIFKGVKFQEFRIQSSHFMALTDTDIAFEGLEEDLVSIIITDSYFLNAWEWSVLRNLKKLIKLHIEANIDAISEDIEFISALELKDISFANNKITDMHDKAFAPFKEIMSISLKNNLIRNVKRSMVPNPALMLWKLDFSNNEIQVLPPDMFENMPSLMTLNLDSNQLLTLNEKPFSEIWERLTYFDAKDNHLRCDCRMSWMLKLRFPENVNAACDQPKSLSGKKLTDLTDKDLWC